MKYMLLIHNDGDRVRDLDGDDLIELTREYLALVETPGVLLGQRLKSPDTATTVRVQDGRTLTTDGPFIEAKEALGGLLIYEADDLDAALAFAARVPAARMGGAVEVRPVAEN